MAPRIIIIDDEKDALTTFRRGLALAGYRKVVLEGSAAKAADLFRRGERFDCALIDLTMPEMNGMELLAVIKEVSPDTECIMVTARDEARVAVECLRLGAYDYLVKPISNQELTLALERALERKQLVDLVALSKQQTPARPDKPGFFKDIVANSPAMLKLLREAELHAASQLPVLITGESGTGKELLARAIHAASPRAEAPFAAINMASISEGLFDAEFFGHTKGAFTGADRERKGYLEHARGGSLFLDEIGTLPLGLQGKLLRVLQEGEYRPVGSDRAQSADVRIIAATNEDLDALVAEGRFRKDLFYRLKVARLHLPPLRERKDDIPLLAEHFLAQTRADAGLDQQALLALMAYDYPGNIRELKSILHAAVNLSRGEAVGPAHLPEQFRGGVPDLPPEEEAEAGSESLAEVEKRHVMSVYRQTGFNKSQTARMLGIGLNTLRRRLKDYGQE